MDTYSISPVQSKGAPYRESRHISGRKYRGGYFGEILGFPYIYIVPILGGIGAKSLIFALVLVKVRDFTGLYSGFFVPIYGFGHRPVKGVLLSEVKPDEKRNQSSN